MLKEIVSLSFEKSVDAIKNESVVMIRSGVWNSYYECAAAKAMECIKNSSYGADVYEDETGMKYVSMPCGSDMW